MSVLIQEVIYLQAQILVMADTPVMALPAPPAGYVNIIFSISHYMDYNGTPYTGGGTISYSSLPGTGQDILNDDDLNENAADVMFTMLSAHTVTKPFITILPLYASMNANPTGAGSTIKAYIAYEQKIFQAG